MTKQQLNDGQVRSPMAYPMRSDVNKCVCSQRTCSSSKDASTFTAERAACRQSL